MFFALGKRDLDLRGVTAANGPVRLQQGDLFAQGGQVVLRLGHLVLGLPQLEPTLLQRLLGLVVAPGHRLLLLAGIFELPLDLPQTFVVGGDLVPVFDDVGLGHAPALGQIGCLPPLVGNLRFDRSGEGLGVGDFAVELLDLLFEGAEFAPTGNLAGGAVPRADHQRTVGGKGLSLEGHKPGTGSCRLGERDGVGELFDDPDVTEKAACEGAILGRGLDETVGPAQHAGPPLQVQRFRGRRQFRVVEPQESHSAGELGGLGLEVGQQVAATGDGHMLGLLAEGDFHQMRRLDAHIEQIGHQAPHVAEGAVSGLASLLQDFFDTGAEPLVTPDEFVENRRPFRNGTSALPQADQVGSPAFQFVAQLVHTGLGRGKLLMPLGGDGFQFQPAAFEGGRFRTQTFQVLPEFGQTPVAAKLRLRGGNNTAFQAADLVAQDCRGAHLFHQDRAALLRLAADLVETRGQLREDAFSFGKSPGNLPVLLLGLVNLDTGLAELLLQISRPVAHGGRLLALLEQLSLQVAASFTLVFDGRFVGGDPLAVGTDSRLGGPDLLVNLAGARFGLKKACLGGLGFRDGCLALLAETGNLLFEAIELLGQATPVDQSDLGAQLLQPAGMLAVAPRLARLGANASQPVVNLVHNVGEPEQVLLNPVEAAEGFDLLGLETADAGRLLEDHAAVLGRSLQQHIDLTLLDDAVGLRPHTGAREKIANIAQPARLAVDQVFPFSAAVDAAGDVDFGRIDIQ